MDKRIQQIVDATSLKFGLGEYHLETWELNKRFDEKGKRTYTCLMEWAPKHKTESNHQEMDSAGTAQIEYLISEDRYTSVVFDHEIYNSSNILFTHKTVEEVAAWVQHETGLVLGEDIRLSDVQENGFQFQTAIDGIDLSPGVMIVVKFDEEGRLTFYNIFGTAPRKDEIEKEKFSITLEEIESIVKQQLILVNMPSEEKKQFIPVYAMDEVYITVKDHRMIPYYVHERSEVEVDKTFEWESPSTLELNREELFFTTEVSVEEAFGHAPEISSGQLTEHEITQSLLLTEDVVRTVFPHESGKWKVDTISREENYIQVKCRLVEQEEIGIKRKFAVFIDLEKLTLLNYMDNEGLFAMFDSFEKADQIAITHDQAFEKLVPFITLDPTYVYDPVTHKYVLCGLLDSSECIHAVTGELLALQDI